MGKRTDDKNARIKNGNVRKFFLIIIITTLLLLVLYSGLFIRTYDEKYSVSYNISIEPNYAGEYSIIIPAVVDSLGKPVVNIANYEEDNVLSVSYVLINGETGVNVTANKPIRIEFEVDDKSGELSFFESTNWHENKIHFINHGRSFHIEFECHFYHSSSSYIWFGTNLDSRASYDERINATGDVDSQVSEISGQHYEKHGDNFPDSYIWVIPVTFPLYLIVIIYLIHRIRKEKVLRRKGK